MTQVTVQEPARVKRLPINKQGYRVPWFVHQVSEGEWDFRVIREQGLSMAHRQRLCWICGQGLSAYKTFVVGPMCVVNRISAEPPSHRECAEYSARVCPFLNRPNMRRRTTGIDQYTPAAGVMIERNPGAVAVWTTKKYTVEAVPPDIGGHEGALFNIGDPVSVEWVAEGRAATREEVEQSIADGWPLLLEAAERGGPKDVAELVRMREEAMKLLPA